MTDRSPILKKAFPILLVAVGFTVLIGLGVGGPVLRDRPHRSVLDALEIEPDSAVPTVLVVFQVGDCAHDRAGLGRWSDLADARVFGALVGPTPERESDLELALERAHVDFPVRTEGARRVERVLAGLGYTRTPIVVGFDVDGRAVELRSLDSFAGESSVETFVDRLRTGTDRG